MLDLKRGLWWVPVGRRMAGWGHMMALMWGWFPFLFGGELGLLFWLNLNSPDAEIPVNAGGLDDGSGPGRVMVGGFLLFCLAVSCAWTVAGLLTGLFAAFLSPETEPQNPIKSRFFRRVGRQTFWFWQKGCLGATFCCLLLALPASDYSLTGGKDNYLALVWDVYLFSLVAFLVLGLWRALDRAWKEFECAVVLEMKHSGA